jgi:hypothetical protein
MANAKGSAPPTKNLYLPTSSVRVVNTHKNAYFNTRRRNSCGTASSSAEPRRTEPSARMRRCKTNHHHGSDRERWGCGEVWLLSALYARLSPKAVQHGKARRHGVWRGSVRNLIETLIVRLTALNATNIGEINEG